MAQGRGKKTNYNKNERAHAEWVAWKKSGRPCRPSKNPLIQAEIERGLSEGMRPSFTK